MKIRLAVPGLLFRDIEYLLEDISQNIFPAVCFLDGSLLQKISDIPVKRHGTIGSNWAHQNSPVARWSDDYSARSSIPPIRDHLGDHVSQSESTLSVTCPPALASVPPEAGPWLRGPEGSFSVLFTSGAGSALALTTERNYCSSSGILIPSLQFKATWSILLRLTDIDLGVSF